MERERERKKQERERERKDNGVVESTFKRYYNTCNNYDNSYQRESGKHQKGGK